MHVLQNINSPTFVKGGGNSRGGNLGVEVLSVAVGGWNSFLMVRADSLVCSVLLIRQSNQVVRHPGLTRLCTRKLRRALCCHVHKILKHESGNLKQHTHYFLSFSPSLSFFFLFQIPTTAVPTHGEWKPNISSRFRQM